MYRLDRVDKRVTKSAYIQRNGYERTVGLFPITFFFFQTALVSPTNDEYEFIVETIKERVEEGQGETIYEIGTGGKTGFLFQMHYQYIN